jgi:hypothetical protein
MSAFDRDQARVVLSDWLVIASPYSVDEIVAAMAACVRPAVLNRDSFIALLEAIDEGDGLFDQDVLYQGILELLRPAEAAS